MATVKPMQGFLNSALKVCLCSGTRVSESGLVASAEKRRSEVILFFHVDCSDGRKCLNMLSDGVRICDYLIFYTKDNDQKEVVCFLELKGGKEKDAVEQIMSTYAGFKRLIAKNNSGQQPKVIENVLWKACILLHGTSPGTDSDAKNKLKKVFGKNVSIKHGINKPFKELSDFLRQ